MFVRVWCGFFVLFFEVFSVFAFPAGNMAKRVGAGCRQLGAGKFEQLLRPIRNEIARAVFDDRSFRILL